jgi:F0F1-type ATP synthase alpha subunit
LLEYLTSGHQGILSDILSKGRLDDELEGRLRNAVTDFKKTVTFSA